jgi:serine/threonine protein kinase
MPDAVEGESIDVLTEDFLARYRRGERPAISEYAHRYPELADDIRALFPTLVLMEQAGAPGTTEAGPATTALASFQCPEHLGEYRILREIGRGGMGVVYEAEQESLARHVALKVFPFHTLMDARHLSRFQREARAAAQLHHSHIVPVFGVGQADGVYFYAMQYIDGKGLDVVLRQINLWRSGPHTTHEQSGAHEPPALGDTAAIADATAAQTDSEASLWSADRATYFRRVARLGEQAAEALAYAHAQGIVHRDIKPSNLILDRFGEIWITDFGLAKFSDLEGMTHSRDVVGTLRYMAPEQLNGWADPRTDVHGLGLTLFELLALRPALDARDRVALLKQVSEQQPPPLTHVEPRVPRDLETIVQKAIAKEPADRYQSATELSADLRRFLADQPIQARRVSAADRLRRWCRRNPGIASLSGTLMVVLAVGFAMVAREWRRAEVNRQIADEQRNATENQLAETEKQRKVAELSYEQARGALDELFFRVSQDIEFDHPELAPLRHDLLASAGRYYREFIRVWADDPRRREELAESYQRLAEFSQSVSADRDVTSDYRRALELRLQIAEEKPDDIPALANLAKSYTALGLTQQKKGQHREAEASLGSALAAWTKLAERAPHESRFQAKLALAHRNYGHLRGRQTHTREAVDHYHRAREIQERLAAAAPHDVPTVLALASTYSGLATRLSELEQHDEVLLWHERALNVIQELAKKNPVSLFVQRDLAQAYNSVGDVHRTNRKVAGWADRAVAAYTQARAIQEGLVTLHPETTTFRRGLVDTLANLGQVYLRSNKPAEAIVWVDLAIAESDKITASTADDKEAVLSALGICWKDKGQSLAALQKVQAAAEAYDRAIDYRRRLIKLVPWNARYRRELAEFQDQRGRLAPPAPPTAEVQKR